MGKKTSVFIPHRANTKIVLSFGIPIIYISQLAYDKMWHYVNLATKEVSWLGVVKQVSAGSFLIKDVYLLRQEVSYGHTEISTEGLSELGQEILKQPDGEEVWNNIRFWGHLHPSGSTSPSKQDDDQMDEFAKDKNIPFFIRAILNKDGKIEFTVYLYRQGVIMQDVEWRIYNPVNQGLRDKIKAEFEEKVTETPTHTTPGTYYRPTTHFPGYDFDDGNEDEGELISVGGNGSRQSSPRSTPTKKFGSRTYGSGIRGRGNTRNKSRKKGLGGRKRS
ncbi:hypothetical protein ACFL14_01000 [Patescibacteria group bacterium]